MRQSLLTRLERLEQRTENGVGILAKAENTWFAIVGGRSREFPTEHTALAYLEQLTETIIIDDI